MKEEPFLEYFVANLDWDSYRLGDDLNLNCSLEDLLEIEVEPYLA